VKFTRRGNVDISARFTMPEQDGGKLEIDVSDTGIGLTRQQMGHRTRKRFSVCQVLWDRPDS